MMLWTNVSEDDSREKGTIETTFGEMLSWDYLCYVRSHSIVEHWGSGIPRLYKNCERAGLREPELIEKAGCFRVNVFRNTELAFKDSEEKRDKKEQKKGTEKRNRKKEQKKGTEKSVEIIERTEKVLKLLNENPNITQAAMMKKLGVTRKKVQLALEKLIEDGRIERFGSDRSGSWKVHK